MTDTARLRLPQLAAAQAQKHVTHNEALMFLDTLVQASVKDKDLTAPPGSPAEGDCYIVAGTGGTATGAWAGWEKRIVRYQDVQWNSFLPGADNGVGWTCWVQDEATLYSFNGTIWVNSLVLAGAGTFREKLAANRTYYVRTDGSDSNNGLANTSGGAFLTIQKAIDTVSGTLDIGAFAITIQVGAGTYTGALTLRKVVGSGTVIILGDTTTPSNCVISVTGANAITCNCPQYDLRGFKTVTTTAGGHFNLGTGCDMTVRQWEFGAAPTGWNHVNCVNNANVLFAGNYKISGGSAAHWFSDFGGLIQAVNLTITLSGTPAFSTTFAQAVRTGAMLVSGNTFSGSATGARYSVTLNGLIDSFGGGASYLPGNSTGSAATGGQYN